MRDKVRVLEERKVRVHDMALDVVRVHDMVRVHDKVRDDEVRDDEVRDDEGRDDAGQDDAGEVWDDEDHVGEVLFHDEHMDYDKDRH